jgi:ribosome-associated heat shock protein Hsp15
MAGVRIDKWLWAARFYKTRGAATEAVVGGRVRLNGERVKPAREVHAEDVVELRIGDVQWTVIVQGLAEKRGPASVAATLYAETPESRSGRERRAQERKLAGADPRIANLGARPTKQERRRYEALRRAHEGPRRDDR